MRQNGQTQNDSSDPLNKVNDGNFLFIVGASGSIDTEETINPDRPKTFLIDNSSLKKQKEHSSVTSDSHIILSEAQKEDDEEKEGEERSNQIFSVFNDDLYFGMTLTEDEEEEEGETIREQEDEDEIFYLANRTFYTTCHKISQQNSPSYRKRPPYNLLENWMIHYIFSKSQQILLRFPVIQPKVMMTEGDFIYTPHQQIAHIDSYYNSNNEHDGYYIEDRDSMMISDNYNIYDEEIEDIVDGDGFSNYYSNLQHSISEDIEDENDEDNDEETFIIGDEPVLVMPTTPIESSSCNATNIEQPPEESSTSLRMDENMWLGHSRYSNNMRLYIVNPDSIEENQENQASSLAIKDDDKGSEEKNILHMHTRVSEMPVSLTMSPEVIQWYRCSSTTPSSNTDYYQRQMNVNQLPIVSSENVAISSTTTAPTNILRVVKETTDCYRNDNDYSGNDSCNSQHSHSSSNNLQSKSSNTSQCSATDVISRTTILKSDEVSNDSYQSLADIMVARNTNSNSNCSYNQHSSDFLPQQSDYGALLTLRQPNDYVVLQKENSGLICTSGIIHISDCLVDSAYIAIELAQSLHDKKNNYDSLQNQNLRKSDSIKTFVSCMFDICSVLFSGVEQMVGWRSFYIQSSYMLRQRQNSRLMV
ncbi:hypothetical protein BDF20DRAFT_835808 [Mycotypha africana]|uniref:uncharacterized protein n=1 Tax=Mycotypha africana TaxID=64632 RepID=UPI0022FFE3C4|nr:uncharacterized protein BDF20DRAFT_835808 [Mycotypha africana]KAI8979846.1 hypothetical protein BDF20DRAFT_835808 [Mycotypha africana]